MAVKRIKLINRYKKVLPYKIHSYTKRERTYIKSVNDKISNIFKSKFELSAYVYKSYQFVIVTDNFEIIHGKHISQMHCGIVINDLENFLAYVETLNYSVSINKNSYGYLTLRRNDQCHFILADGWATNGFTKLYNDFLKYKS